MGMRKPAKEIIHNFGNEFLPECRSGPSTWMSKRKGNTFLSLSLIFSTCDPGDDAKSEEKNMLSSLTLWSCSLWSFFMVARPFPSSCEAAGPSWMLSNVRFSICVQSREQMVKKVRWIIYYLKTNGKLFWFINNYGEDHKLLHTIIILYWRISSKCIRTSMTQS